MLPDPSRDQIFVSRELLITTLIRREWMSLHALLQPLAILVSFDPFDVAVEGRDEDDPTFESLCVALGGGITMWVDEVLDVLRQGIATDGRLGVGVFSTRYNGRSANQLAQAFIDALNDIAPRRVLSNVLNALDIQIGSAARRLQLVGRWLGSTTDPRIAADLTRAQIESARKIDWLGLTLSTDQHYFGPYKAPPDLNAGLGTT